MTANIAIFGATSAIAAGTARVYAARGAQLYLVGRNSEKLEALKQELGAAVVGTAVQDFDDTSAAQSCVERVAAALGKIDIALIALTVYLIMYAFSFMYKLATPVFLSFVVYLFIEPPARWLNKLGMKKSIASAISILLFTLVILSMFLGAGYIIADQAKNLISNLPEYQQIMKDAAIVPFMAQKTPWYHSSRVKGATWLPIAQQFDFTNLWLSGS